AAAVLWTILHINWQARGKALPIPAPASAARTGERMTVIFPSGPVPINTAKEEALCRLPGIGPALAEAIIVERQTHGAFYYPEDLLSVRGIGTKKLAGILDQITLE
ncbi:MAG: helix-hairpin-helix domain-containing protein, partial [Clostridia bacterium]|nr:helix-hairpin-helix domain-containing protein [Clostridia bacterium]